METDDIADEFYHSEINFTISTFWDAGYTGQLGDSINGYSEEVYGNRLVEVMRDLKELAIKQGILTPNK